MIETSFLFILAIGSALIGSFAGGGTSFFVISFLLLFWPDNNYLTNLSLAKTVAVAMVCASAKVHWQQQKNINWSLLNILIISGIIGTAIGTYAIYSLIPENIIKPLLGILLIVCAGIIGYKSSLGTTKNLVHTYSHKQLIITFLVTLLINILNGIYGGTGIFGVLFMVLFLRMNFIQAAAYSSFQYIVINILQSSYLISIAAPDTSFVVIAIIGGLVGSFVGTKLQYLKGNTFVKKAALSLMLILGLNMLLKIF